MPQPIAHSDIIFPHLSNTPNFSNTLSSLRRSALSVHNRLLSICEDYEFVAAVSQTYGLPLLANERCGSWYIPPEDKIESVYFKSTDGHMNQWSFSLRRLNLQIFDVIAKWSGCIIVDSTRRGKSMPDALSKTVPMWCCVMNRAVFGNKHEKHKLYSPPQAVSASEHAQMETRIDHFVQQFLEICKPNIAELRLKIQKPLRPIWVTQESTLPDTSPVFSEFRVIVLCTASRRVRGAEASEGGYIQGAADDHEAWARGLTPQLFWAHKDRLLCTNEEDMSEVIEELSGQERGPEAVATLIKPTSHLYVSSSKEVDLRSFDAVISCTPEPLSDDVLKEAGVTRYMHLKCQTGKLGSRDLRVQLPGLRVWLPDSSEPGRVLICCPTGKDVSVGTALAFLCLFVDDEGAVNMLKCREAKDIDKTFIKQRLSWITTSNPALNPSRATLQSVNTILMSGDNAQNHVGWRMIQQTLEDGKELSTAADVAANTFSRLATSDEKSKSMQYGPYEGGSEGIMANIFSQLVTSEEELWKFTRTLQSALASHPSGTVTGSATFRRCSYAGAPPDSSTMLYSEEGEFVTESGQRFTARRKYVYQLRVGDDRGNGKKVAVFFFDDEKMPRGQSENGVGESGEGIGGLFVETGELAVNGSAHEAKNRAQHLCGEDLYAASWRFGEGMTRSRNGEGSQESEGNKLWWEVRYDVKGPKKDYTSETRYERM